MKAIVIVVTLMAVVWSASAVESSPKNNQKREVWEHHQQHPAHQYRGLHHQQPHYRQQHHQQQHGGQFVPQNRYVYYQQDAVHPGSHQQFVQPLHLHEWEAQKARAQEQYKYANAHYKPRHQGWVPHHPEYIQNNHINYEQSSHPQGPQQHRQYFWDQQNPAMVKHVTGHKVVYPSEVPRYVPVPMSMPQVRVENKVQQSSVVVEKSIPVYTEKQIVYPVQHQSAVHDPNQRPAHKEPSVIRVAQPMAVHVDKPYPVYMTHQAYMEKTVPMQVFLRNADHK